MPEEKANYIFLPWVQAGAAAAIPASAADKLGPAQPGVVSVSVKVEINSESVARAVRLYGPGEITGLDPRQVVRTEPRHLASDFEPNYFPCIEFDRPDLPWLFTPARSGAQGRLRPWLCLVVVRKQPGVALRPAVTTPLPALEIKAPAEPADELPDLSESWAWAHAQVTGSERAKLKETLENSPARSVSRLLCPRRLEPNTEYIACVVPTFELGRRAGLDLPIQPADEQRLDPAWASGRQSPAEVTLPVYYHWAFRTGTGGDFEELVRRLRARQMPPGVGKRPMDISRPGFNAQQPAGFKLGLEGALRVAQGKSDEWDAASRVRFQTELKRILNLPWKFATAGGNQDPVVGPPIYGRWHAGVPEVAVTHPPSPQPPPVWPPPFWLDELNLDPRQRVAAGAGTAVIQREQEALTASAWEQLGDLKKVNQRLRLAQLSRAVNTVYHTKTFSRLSADAFVKVIAPSQTHVRVGSTSVRATAGAAPAGQSLALKLADSVVPAAAVSASMRRLTRPRGAINRTYTRAGSEGMRMMLTHLNQVAEPGEVVWFEDAPPAGAKLQGDEPWRWVNANPTPYAGTLGHQSNVAPGVHQHFFTEATNRLAVKPGDKLYTYVFLDPANPPAQVMLQWHVNNSWEHRAFWGADKIGWGAIGTDSRRHMGGLPPTGRWVRLEVPAGSVGLGHQTVDGMAFTLFGGRATWDRAGKVIPFHKGAITINQVSDALPVANAQGLVWVTDTPGVAPHWERARAIDAQMRSTYRPERLTSDNLRGLIRVPPNLTAFREVAMTHQDYLGQVFGFGGPLVIGGVVPTFKTGATFVTADVKTQVLVGVDPNRTFNTQALGVAAVKPPNLPGDPLEPVMAAPTFPQPMYEALRDLSPDFLFPGLEEVPPDSVQVLETNVKFIESFMVGLNTEMGRELLWRGYPTDQRGTYFPFFWDSLDDTAKAKADISAVHQWRGQLGGNATGAASGNKLVLLIRGELLRRYPNTVIYAVKAVPVTGGGRTLSDKPADELHPVFRGTLDPDVTFLGFDLTVEKATAGAGYFFVLQQQPTEPRFGMDAAPFSTQSDRPNAVPALQSWDDLNWGHLAGSEAELKALSHVSLGKALKPTGTGQGVWGHNSAHMAYITKQLPARIAIHASQMLPTK